MAQLVRITASNSSKHTPKSIAKHQHYKSTGILPKKIHDNTKKLVVSKNSTSRDEYAITSYNDLVLYPEFQEDLENDMEDELIDEEDVETNSGAENAVIKGVKFLQTHKFDPNLPAVAKGVVTRRFKDKIQEKRNYYPPIIIRNQLYSLFSNQMTKVDREIEKLIIEGQLIKLIINHIQFNDNMIMLKSEYLKIVERNSRDNEVLKNFYKLIHDNNGVSLLTRQDLQKYDIYKADDLIDRGFLNYSENQNEFYISLPNLGNYLNFLKRSSGYVLNIIQKSNSKQILEKNLVDRWEFQNNNWYKFYGLDLRFVLSLNYGMGFIENFNTNVGNGWKLS